ncbi:MAG: hypothetical protein Q8P29_00075 [Candidatus Levybacteria bacterium]|nr:hypothetical protein [Candidatus Levybacteria bacterium]
MKTIALSIREYLLLRLNIVVYSLGFCIPFVISQPQLVTGTIVNSLFFIAAEKLDKKALYPMLILPSIGAVLHGVLFGPQTMFLFYFLPFIWIGNYLQVNVFSFAKRQNYLVRIFSSALAKYLLLFIAANIYYKVHIVPQLFITSMGALQFITACLGGFLAYFILKLLNKNE